MGAALALTALAIALRWGAASEGYFDSAFYLDGARHIARGDGYVSASTAPDHADFDPVTHWAPGLPLMIASAIRLGLAPLTAASLVLTLCYVGAVLCVYALGIALAGRAYAPLSFAVSLLFALQPSTLRWMRALLSDLPLAAFVLFDLWLAVRLMRAERPSLRLRVAFGVGLAAMATVRYAGMLYLPGLLFATALGMRAPRTLVARALALWPSALIACSSVGVWSLRNHHVAAGPFGNWLIQRSDPVEHTERAVHAGFAFGVEALQCAGRFGLRTAAIALLALGGLCLAVLAVMSWRRAWRELCLVGLPAASYFVAMIATASTMLLASLSETRFWVAVWPLVGLFALVAIAHAAQRAALPFRFGAIAALLGMLGLFGFDAYRGLPPPHPAGRGLLNARWERASAMLPPPERCRMFTMDPRPFMLHRALGPTSAIPLTRAEFDAAVARYPNVCVSVVDKHLRLSTSAERRRVEQDVVVASLLSEQRLDRIARGRGVTTYVLRKSHALAHQGM